MKKKPEFYIRLFVILAASQLFAGTYNQLPLFSGNQNCYFLKGMANAGYGQLSADWLAKCTDQIPVFTAMVTFIHLHCGDWMFYLLQGILVVIYFLSLYAIVIKAFPRINRTVSMSLFLIFFTVSHCIWFGNWFNLGSPGLSNVLNIFKSLSVIITSGLAGQYGYSIPLQAIIHCPCSCTFIIIALTCIQLITASRSLALLFPWRISVCLVPISTFITIGLISVLAGNFIENILSIRSRRFLEKSLVALAGGVLLATSVLGAHQTLTDACNG